MFVYSLVGTIERKKCIVVSFHHLVRVEENKTDWFVVSKYGECLLACTKLGCGLLLLLLILYLFLRFFFTL